MSLYQRGQTWWIYLVHPVTGQRIRESARTADRGQAQRYEDERRAELWRETGAAPRERTWHDACTAWLTAAERSASDRYSLRALNYTERPLSQVTRESIEAALAGKTPATYNRYRALIVAICNHAGHPLKIPLRKTKPGRIRFLSREEWDRLYAELPAHLKPLARFALATGLRQHNVTHLRWDQIDLRRRVAWVHADETKADKAIGIPLSDEAVDTLRGQIGKSTEWVFPYTGRGRAAGKPIAKIKTAWQLAMERAGLGRFRRKLGPDGKLISKKWEGDFTWHGLRHTWASWHVMAGTPLEVLQKLGGWADLKMVMRYAHLAPEYLAGYANNATPYESGGKLDASSVA